MQNHQTISYAKSHNRKPFNWYAFLTKEWITEQEWEQVRFLSANWITCACGNQCDILPRTQGEPDDVELKRLGRDFNEFIKYKCKKEALETLKLIEARSSILIAEILKK